MGVSNTTAWRRAHPDRARLHRETEARRWHESPAIREKHRQHNREFRIRLKLETFEAYGGACCACCGEAEIHFLSLDHIHNDGAAQRRELGIKGGGHAFYGWLRAHNYPPGYQVLCMNCNFGKRMNNGVCPHKLQSQEDWE